MLKRNSHKKDFSLLTEKEKVGLIGVIWEKNALYGHRREIFKPIGLPSSTKGKKTCHSTKHHKLCLYLNNPGTPDDYTLSNNLAWEER